MNRVNPVVKIRSKLDSRRLLLALTAAISFVIIRLLQFLFAGQYPVTYPDSDTYRISEGNQFDFTLVVEQARPTLVTAFYAILPNDSTRVTAQWFLSTAAWVVLLVAIAMTWQLFWVAAVSTISVWVVGLSYFALQWDGTILSESLSITSFVFGIGFLFWWWVNQRSWLAFASLISFGAMALNRPNMWVVLLGLTVVILLVSRRVAVSARTLVALTATGLIFLGLSLIQQNINDERFGGREGLNRVGWSYSSMLSDESPIAESLIASLQISAAPRCLVPSEPFTSDDGPINIIIGLQDSCPEGVTWINNEFLNWYGGFLISNPVMTFKGLSSLVGPSAQALPYGLDSQIQAPTTLRKIVSVESSATAISLVIISLSAGAVALALRRRANSTTLVWALLILEVSLIASWALGALLQVWDLHRTIVTNVVGINLIALLLIAAALDSFQSSKPKTEKAA